MRRIVAGLFLLMTGFGANAQCSVTTTQVNTFGTIISVAKLLDTSVVCQSVMNMNVNACFPTVANNTMFLVASAMTASTNPSCAFTCNCGISTPSITIDGSDGLPVELMDFEVGDK